MWSQKILKTASIGTASNIPGTIQSQPQNMSATNTATGFKVNRRATIAGVINWPYRKAKPA